MKTLTKNLILASFVLVSATQASWAGWGAIACSDNTGACTWVQGAYDYDSAVNGAMNRCEEEYGACNVARWEHNQCVDQTASNGVTVQACY